MEDSQRLMSLISVIVVVLVIIFFIAGAIFLANLIARPLSLVSQGLKEISEGEGDLTKELQVKSNDETGELAGYFNAFLKAIRQLVQQISQAGQSMGESATKASMVSQDLAQVSERQKSSSRNGLYGV
ncbi:HAMP domain-containing protein [Vibrio sinaloensis]|nr:HAMP domain-containing protein [Vibrio sinaloensis]